MSDIARRMIGEAVERPATESQAMNEVKEVIVKTRPVEYHECPHCHNEIFEKHTFIEGDFMSGNYTERHSDCKGAIKFPEQPIQDLAPWLQPLVAELKAMRKA